MLFVPQERHPNGINFMIEQIPGIVISEQESSENSIIWI